MLYDLIFENNDNLVGIEESDREHQKDILIHLKGWDKFNPHLGVGIMNYIEDEGNVAELKNEVELELEKDGMTINATQFKSNGEIKIDANY